MSSELVLIGGNAELRENSTKSDLLCQERLYDLRSNMSINYKKDSKLTLPEAFS